jgi:hypothetical protein
MESLLLMPAILSCYTLIFYLSIGGGGSGGGGVNPSPSKPTWAQILNSNPSTPSNASSSSSSLSQPIANTMTTMVATGTISPSQISTGNTGAFPFSTSHSGFRQNVYDKQQSNQPPSMNWPLTFNQSSNWMTDHGAQRQTNLAAASVQSSLESNHLTSGGGDGTPFVSLLASLARFFVLTLMLLLYSNISLFHVRLDSIVYACRFRSI